MTQQLIPPTRPLEAGLYLVATPIGHLEDITLRALRILRDVDQIAAEDTRTARKLLNAYDLQKPTFSLYRDNEAQRVPRLIEHLQEGQSVALISEAGMPGISDPGYVAVQHVLEAGFPVIPIPGANAVTTALLPSGLPCDRFMFLGFLPPKSGKRRQHLAPYLHVPSTLVLYASPHKLPSLLEDLEDILGDRRACIARELTKSHEEFCRGTLSELAAQFADESRRKGEFVLLIEGHQGPVETVLESEQQETEEARIEARIQTLLKEGVRPSKLARKLTAEFPSLSRKRAYQQILALEKHSEDGQKESEES